MHTKLKILTLVLTSCFLNGCIKKESAIIGTITSISPTSGGAGTLITINGNGFGTAISDNVVLINGKTATLKSASATMITAEVPTDAGTGPVAIQVGTKTITGPIFTYLDAQVTKTYFFKFKVNGSWKVFESGTHFYQSCGDCACFSLPPLDDNNNATLSICNPDNDWIVGSDITGWNQKTILYAIDSFPHASFSYTSNETEFLSSNTTDQGDSFVKITKVENDEPFFNKNSYKVTGTFQCKVVNKTTTILITEGQFVVNFSEE